VIPAVFQRPFERLQFLRTMEQALIDCLQQQPEFFDLLGRVHEHYLKEVECWADTEVDGIYLMDDWGHQQGLIIAPEIFRRFFKPLYREYAEIAHARGKYVFMHSDGKIDKIIPDLIESGIDALNSQIFCMGVERLGNAFAGKLTFWGEIDRQNLLARGSAKEVANAVANVHQALYRNGGVIAQCEFGPGAKPENIFTVFREWDKISQKQTG
jgi:uroporphyrinogen-III decarboxylase